MADTPPDDFLGPYIGLDAVTLVGSKVIEMCDETLKTSKFAPGIQSRWKFEMNGQRFVVLVGMVESD